MRGCTEEYSRAGRGTAGWSRGDWSLMLALAYNTYYSFKIVYFIQVCNKIENFLKLSGLIILHFVTLSKLKTCLKPGCCMDLEQSTWMLLKLGL